MPDMPPEREAQAPSVLRDGRGRRWLVCPDGRYLEEGDISTPARRLYELCSGALAADIGPLSEVSPAGWCRQLAELAAACDPRLTVVRGWYHDLAQGRREHWWTVRPDGTIHDPSSAQFSTPGVSVMYEEFDGTLECEQCGRSITEDQAIQSMQSFDSLYPVCSPDCFRRLVGL